MAPGLAFEAEVENDPLGLLRDLVQGHKDSLMNSPRDLASPLVQEELDQKGQRGKLSGWTVDQNTENMLHSESQHEKVIAQGTNIAKKRATKIMKRRLKLPIRIRMKSKQHTNQGTQNLKKSRETKKPETMRGETSEKEYADTYEWRPKKGKAAPKPSLLKNIQASYRSLDSLTAPKPNSILLPNPQSEVKLVHRSHKKEVVEMRKLPDPVKPIVKKAMKRPEARVAIKRLRSRQPKKDSIFGLSTDHEGVPETIKMSTSFEGRPKFLLGSRFQSRDLPQSRELQVQSREVDIRRMDTQDKTKEAAARHFDTEDTIDNVSTRRVESNEKESKEVKTHTPKAPPGPVFGMDSFSTFAHNIPGQYDGFGPDFDVPKLNVASPQYMEEKKSELSKTHVPSKVVPKREIPSYSAALKEHTYKLKDYKVPKKNKDTSNLYVHDPWKGVELSKIVPDPRPYKPDPTKKPKEKDVFSFNTEFTEFQDFTPDIHLPQSHQIEETYKPKVNSPEPYNPESYQPTPYKPYQSEPEYRPEPYHPKPDYKPVPHSSEPNYKPEQTTKPELYSSKPVYEPSKYNQETFHSQTEYRPEPEQDYKPESYHSKPDYEPNYKYKKPTFRPSLHYKPHTKLAHDIIKVPAVKSHQKSTPFKQSHHDNKEHQNTPYNEPTSFSKPAVYKPSSYGKPESFIDLAPHNKPDFYSDPAPHGKPAPHGESEPYSLHDPFIESFKNPDSYHQSSPLDKLSSYGHHDPFIRKNSVKPQKFSQEPVQAEQPNRFTQPSTPDPFLRSQVFKQPAPFFSQTQTEVFHEPNLVVHPINSFHGPESDFFRDLPFSSPNQSQGPNQSPPAPRALNVPEPGLGPVSSPNFGLPRTQRRQEEEFLSKFTQPSFDTFLGAGEGFGPGSFPSVAAFSPPELRGGTRGLGAR